MKRRPLPPLPLLAAGAALLLAALGLALSLATTLGGAAGDAISGGARGLLGAPASYALAAVFLASGGRALRGGPLSRWRALIDVAAIVVLAALADAFGLHGGVVGDAVSAAASSLFGDAAMGVGIALLAAYGAYAFRRPLREACGDAWRAARSLSDRRRAERAPRGDARIEVRDLGAEARRPRRAERQAELAVLPKSTHVSLPPAASRPHRARATRAPKTAKGQPGDLAGQLLDPRSALGGLPDAFALSRVPALAARFAHVRTIGELRVLARAGGLA